MNNKYFGCQALILLGGTIFAWYTVSQDFARLAEFGYEWNEFGGIFPNPMATPCFYGAIAFLIALIGAIYIYRSKIDEIKNLWQLRLTWLLGAGVIYAISNFSYTLYKFYILESHVGCSGAMITNPWTTPCAIGTSFFIISFALAYFINKRRVAK